MQFTSACGRNVPLSVEGCSEETVPPCNKRSVNRRVIWQLPRKAADDEIRASRKPKPPNRIGREACNQAASEIEDWVILPRA